MSGEAGGGYRYPDDEGEELAGALAEFLAASVAVWREIDRLDERPEGYHPTAMDVELRKRERAAWEQYRDLLDDAERSERAARG